MDTVLHRTTAYTTVFPLQMAGFNNSKRFYAAASKVLTEATHNTSCVDFTVFEMPKYKCMYIFHVHVIAFLCLVGLLGNSITIAVLRRDRDPQRQKSTNWLLETLAMVDIIYLAFAVIFLPITTIALNSDALPMFRMMFPYLLAYLFPFAPIVHIMTIWIVIFITVDRYLAICRPLHPEWRRLRRVRIAVWVLLILDVIFNIPRFLEMKVISKESCTGAERRAVAVQREFAKSLWYGYIYEAGCDYVFRSVGPLVILIILNVRIAWAIKELNRKRREMTLQAKEEKTLTVMLIIVVIIFVICQLPMTVMSTILPTAVFYPTTVHWNSLACAFGAANALNVLNSSINFLVYCLIWRKFNRILVRMMACKEENGHVQNL